MLTAPSPPWATTAAGQAPARSQGTVRAVLRVGLTVSELDRLVPFYTAAFGCSVVGEWSAAGARLERLYGLPSPQTRSVRLRLGAEELDLTEFVAPRGRRVPLRFGADEGWFRHVAIVVSDIYRAARQVERAGATPTSAAPQRIPYWNATAGGVRAFYFRDPDGHPLELIEYPAGRGDPRWQQRGGALFLGIDHTAIVVADTGAATAFYLGCDMRVSGTSLNYGIEQELLSGVADARVRITTLAAAGGPGIELLEYLQPRRVRASPTEARASDLLHAVTTVAVDDASVAWQRLTRSGARGLTKGVARVPDVGGWTAGFLVRDPHGHPVQIVQTPQPWSLLP
jgi:catechol 2,3-dioxygenase-like lactoylglutathione lyase family enzyme